MKITKALKNRSAAVRSALTTYNKLAPTVTPPRPILDYDHIISYTTLGEFDLLRAPRQSIHEKVWAKPRYREALQTYYKIRCAEKEITRLNVEIKRLRTFIRDEEEDYTAAIVRADAEHPTLAAELRHRWAARSAVNTEHLRQLDKISCLRGYTGSGECGTRVGRAPHVARAAGEAVAEVGVEGADVSDSSSQIEADVGHGDGLLHPLVSADEDEDLGLDNGDEVADLAGAFDNFVVELE